MKALLCLFCTRVQSRKLRRKAGTGIQCKTWCGLQTYCRDAHTISLCAQAIRYHSDSAISSWVVEWKRKTKELQVRWRENAKGTKKISLRFEVSALRGTLNVWWALIFLTHATDFAEKQGLLSSIVSVKRLINNSVKQYFLQLRWFCPMRYFL